MRSCRIGKCNRVTMFITFLALSSSFIELISLNIITRVSIDKPIYRGKLNAYTGITIRSYIMSVKGR